MKKLQTNGVPLREAMVENYDCAIDESYETFFDDIYFEAGMLVGFQLYKELTKKYEHHAGKDISSILEKRKQPLDTDHEVSSVLESFCMHRLNTALEESIRKNKSYQKKDEELQ